MNKEQLRNTANAMVQKGKGILAADESNPTCGKRFDGIGVNSTEMNRAHAVVAVSIKTAVELKLNLLINLKREY